MYYLPSLWVCVSVGLYVGEKTEGSRSGAVCGGLQPDSLSRPVSREALVPLGQLQWSPESPPRLRGSPREGFPALWWSLPFHLPEMGSESLACSFVLMLPEEGGEEGWGRERVSCPVAETIRTMVF